MADAVVLLDDDGADAAATELDRGREADRPRADDQNLGRGGRERRGQTRS
jgi:hypothetical protein